MWQLGTGTFFRCVLFPSSFGICLLHLSVASKPLITMESYGIQIWQLFTEVGPTVAPSERLYPSAFLTN